MLCLINKVRSSIAHNNGYSALCLGTHKFVTFCVNKNTKFFMFKFMIGLCESCEAGGTYAWIGELCELGWQVQAQFRLY